MTNLTPWWGIAEPREDVRQGQLPESVFAADLGAVVQNNAPEIYQDAISFYEKTHITQVIENLLTQTVENIGGQPSGNRIQRLQTGFGGGKTHILLAIYHLLNSPEELQELEKIQAILNDSQIDTIPDAKTAVIVGSDLDASGGRDVEDIHLDTMWGELAYQLGGTDAYELIEASDNQQVSPGKDKLVEILETTRPCVILVDEFLQYVDRAQGIEVGGTTLSAQTISFLDELVRAISTTDEVFAVLSLQASERFEMYSDPENAERLLNQIESKVERVDKVERPIDKSDVFNIARQRLFDSLGEKDDHGDVAAEYHGYYQENPSDFPDRVQEPDYRDRIVEAYPFHPEFIEVLYDQWGSMPGFQRTRGVLRFLAKVVSDQYQNQPDTPLIQPGQLNMGDPDVRDEALDYLEEGWDSVVGSDIAGDDSRADQIDRQMGDVYHSKHVTRSLVASLFLYSHGGGQRLGATLEDLRLGVLHPGMATPLVADAISKCKDTLFYLYEEEGLYRFRKTPNLNRVISDYESEVEEDDKTREIRDAFSEVIGDSAFSVHIWPTESGDIPDDHSLRLAILHPDQALDSGAEETMERVQKLWEDHKDEFRAYRNSVVFLAAEAASVTDLRDAATTKAALKEIRANRSVMDGLTDEQVEDFEDRLQNATEALPSEIRNVYSEAVIPKNSELQRASFDPSLLTSDKGVDELLQEKLEEEDLLLSRLDPNLLASDYWNIWPTEETDEGEEVTAGHITTQQLWEHFGQLAQLPMLESQDVLTKCIAQGVDEAGVFGYGKLTEDSYTDVRFQEKCTADDVTISDNTVIIRESEARRVIQDQEEEPVEEGEPAEQPEAAEATAETEEAGLGSFTEGGEGSGAIGTGQEIETQSGGPATAVERVEIQANPDWETQWDEAYESIIQPLVRLGADIDIEVTVTGQSEEGLDRTSVERQVEEHLTQRGIEHTIKYDDGEEQESLEE